MLIFHGYISGPESIFWLYIDSMGSVHFHVFFLTWQSAIQSSSYPVNALMNPQPTQWGTTVSKFHRILWVDLNPNFPVNLSTQLWWLNKFLVNITHVYIYIYTIYILYIHIYIYIRYIYYIYTIYIYIHTCIHTDRHTYFIFSHYIPLLSFLYIYIYVYIVCPLLMGAVCPHDPFPLPNTPSVETGFCTTQACMSRKKTPWNWGRTNLDTIAP